MIEILRSPVGKDNLYHQFDHLLVGAMAYQASDSTVIPGQFGAYGKLEVVPYGELEHRVFSSQCPPVVTPDTTIIAVCGPNDWKDNASPMADGCFFSDFFLFHHLFRGTVKQQYWMTCVNPKHIIDKYTELVHGDPRSNDRRVVLDESMKEDVKDVIVFNANDLLERFSSYVADASMQVKNTQRPILVLVFGHGVEDIYSITIGGSGDFRTCPKLTRPKFNEALLRHNPNPNVAMLISSCFGGGWIQTTYLNITAMAGVNHEEELLSWPESGSIGRCCGSRYSTGIAKALIEMEVQGLDLSSDEGQEVVDSPTFATLVAIIHEILTQKVDVREENDISFAAKDDVWGMEWRARTGFPMTSYLEKWEALRLIEKSGTTGTSQSASGKSFDTTNLLTPEAEFRVKRLAYEYMQSNPGPDEAAKNHHVHSACNRLLRGEKLSSDALEYLGGELRYRMRTVMNQATEYKDRLGISFADCRECDSYTYKGRVRRDKGKHTRFSQIFQMVIKGKLFDEPGEGEGMPYIKGTDYLSMVLCESGWNVDKIKSALDELVKLRSESILIHHNRTKLIVSPFLP